MQADQQFDRWSELLILLQDAFAYLQGRIDRHSSLLRMDAEALAAKAQREKLSPGDRAN